MNYTDLITIAIPVYERTEYFEEAFLSAVNQTVKCPVIVVDNHSSHHYFKDYIENYNKQNQDKVRYIQNSTNLGMVGNWNECINQTSTPFLTILHDDDALHQSFIEIVSQQINKGYQFFSSGAFIQTSLPKEFNSTLVKVNRFDKFKSTFFLFESLSPFPGIVFPVEKAKEIGGFTESKYPISDYDFWIRLSKTCRCYKTKTRLAFYRISEKQETKKEYLNIINMTFEIRKELQYYYLLKYFSLYSLYDQYKFYNRGSSIESTKETLNSELYQVFNHFNYIESKYVLNLILKTVNKLSAVFKQ